MSVDLFSLAEKVHDEETFVEFLRELMRDREKEIALEIESPSSPYGAGALGWQNITIEGFLESAIAWSEGTNHPSEHYKKPGNPWARAAQIIHAGKIYE
ncbi:hypothetical protein GNX18_12625 [Microbulbifer sp. SH-1]|uniref:DUF7660 family protein n=1 Tax=Microbulbifer sp. SH-1 TaxID=2681547 RepID=UPI00140D43D6|nr:hypothetical protein [Microbulbifer sp. SH-1]QIL90507.1 hypothetical protein GNX18_12625 [Microbulbifer sp. SH-1]